MKHSAKHYHPVDYYFIADPSYWPLVGSVGLFTTVLGLVQFLHQSAIGPYLMALGITILLITMAGWFGAVIKESTEGLHSEQMDRTYRWGMVWFIVSELFLFGIFFFALFYTRVFSLTELGNTAGELASALYISKGSATHQYLWPHFDAVWPLLVNPNPKIYPGPEGVALLKFLLCISIFCGQMPRRIKNDDISLAFAKLI